MNRLAKRRGELSGGRTGRSKSGGNFGRWTMAAVCLALLPTSPAIAGPLVAYSFTAATHGETDMFTAGFKAPGIAASLLTTHNMGITGVVTNFIGATNNNGYVFDGKGFATLANALIDGGSSPEPTNNYVEFTLTAPAGRALTITNVSVDFGLDDGTINRVDTRAQYDLYLSSDGSSFTPMGTTASHSNVGKDYPGYTIRNDVDKPVSGFSGITNTIVFRLAFSDSNSTSTNKRVFFDDIVVSGSVVDVIELTLDDKFAYEGNQDLIALFKVSRGSTNGSNTISFTLSPNAVTNGMAAPGADYTASPSGTLSFLPGDASKSVRINPLEDGQTEPPERIELSLEPSATYVVKGGVSNASAVLYDDEVPGIPVCFHEDFGPGYSSGWTVMTNSSANVTNIVDFAYDYFSMDGIPSAPGATNTLGLKLGFITSPGATQGVINVYHPLPANCSTNKYELSFYAYLRFDAITSLVQHAMAGLSDSPTQANWVDFGMPPTVHGQGPFVTLIGNDSTDTNLARLHLWDPDVSSSTPLDRVRPGSLVDQLFNNPPYGASGGSAGILGCDVASTNGAWLYCQFMKLDDVVRFTINGYPLLDGDVSSQQGLLRSAVQFEKSPPIATVSVSFGAIMLGYLSQTFGVSDANHFVVFDSVDLKNLESIAITSMAILTDSVSSDVYFNFYSQLSTSFSETDFELLATLGLDQPFEAIDARLDAINKDIAGTNGYYGGRHYSGFNAGYSVFYQTTFTNVVETAP